MEYLVHWKGYSDADWTWVPAKELSYAQELVQEFLSRQKPKEGIQTLQAQWEPKEGILLWTESVTTCKQGTPKLSPSKTTPKPSYSHVVWVMPRAHDPGKVLPDLSRVQTHDWSCVTSHDKPVPLGSHDIGTCDPGNQSHDLPRDWSCMRSHANTWSHDQTCFCYAPSPLIGMWKTVGTINGVSSNQPSHKTPLHNTMTQRRSTRTYPCTILGPALKYGPPIWLCTPALNMYI